MKKVLVIGLDCADPRLVFDRYLDSMPNIKKMMENSSYGKMKTCFPAITIPAWMVMASGREPGELGVYGFRQRDGTDYTSMKITTSGLIKGPKIWDLIEGESVLVGVPPTYPPPKINGNLVSCFITPGMESGFTYPGELKDELLSVLDGHEYLFDVVFRTESRDEVLEKLYKMTDRRFKVIEHLMKEKPWQLFWFVEIGVDRIHHTFWKFADPEHPKYEPGNKYENVIREYYSYIDEKIGELLKLIDEDTYVLVVSDHGAKPMKGAFAINEWLMEKGYLKLKEGATPEAGSKLKPEMVDWGKTKAWAWGGYYSRVFLNVAGREPEGIIPQSEYENERRKLMEELNQIRGPDGEEWENRVYTPQEIYSKTEGETPDIMVYFDNLSWRAAGTIGYTSPYLNENDTGPDDAMHAEEGMYLLYHPSFVKKKQDVSIYDIAPTLLKIMGKENNELKGRCFA